MGKEKKAKVTTGVPAGKAGAAAAGKAAAGKAGAGKTAAASTSAPAAGATTTTTAGPGGSAPATATGAGAGAPAADLRRKPYELPAWFVNLPRKGRPCVFTGCPGDHLHGTPCPVQKAHLSKYTPVSMSAGRPPRRTRLSASATRNDW